MPNVRKRPLGIIGLAIISIALILFCPVNYISAEEAESVDDETCLDCHEQFDLSLRPGPHRLSSEISKPVATVACVSCHDRAEAHLEDPDRGTIVNPALLSGFKEREVCFSCHNAHVELDNYGFDTHSIEELNCSSCHLIHGYSSSLLLDDRAEFCRNCHIETFNAFMKSSNHPIEQENLTCLSCHRFVKRLDDNIGFDLSSPCRDCHGEQAGPFLYEHDAVNAYAVEGGGCVVCHTPHGSANDRLLAEPGNQLCRQCHLPVGHLTAHAGIWAEYDCQVCHTETHGSFVSNLYLDPNLPEKFGGDCYNTGCHSLNR